MRKDLTLLAPLIAIACIGLAPASAAGEWKYQVIPNDGHVLTFSDDGKVTFYLGCGRGFALHVKYPGEARKQGKARIRYRMRKPKWHLTASLKSPSRSRTPSP